MTMKKILIALFAASALVVTGAVAIACDGDKTETAAATECDRGKTQTAAAETTGLASVVLTVSDATCGGCVVPIRKELATLAGIHTVQGSEADHKDVIVWFEAGSVTTAQMIEAVKKAGYTAAVKPEDTRQS
jgi:copper chaperone CopZ